MSFTRSPGYSNPCGFSVTEPGNKGSVYNKQSLPGGVTNFVPSNPQETTVDLTWDPALDATLYYLVSSPPMTNFNTSDTFFSFTGLTPDTEYTFTITPSNVNGNGPPTTSDPISTLLPLPGPGPAPYNTFTDLTTTTIGVSWINGVTPYATSYNVYAYVVYPEVVVGFQNTPTSPYIYTGLQPNYAYFFKITGVNATGEGEPGAGSVTAWTVPEVTGFSAGNPQETTVDLTWDAPDISVVNNIQWEITSTPTTTTQTASDYNSFPIPYTFTGLTPDTEYTFTITPQVGQDLLAGEAVTSDPISTLIQVNLAYTGTIETLELRPGNYRFQMAGGSGPLRSAVAGGAGRCFAEFILDYTVTSTITIQYAIGQASPGDVGGAGGTYIYDQTNSRWLFIAGGAGTNDFSPVPFDVFDSGVPDPGDGSGGAEGSGGGSGAGVNSSGSSSLASGAGGGATWPDLLGGIGGGFGEPQFGGFGGGGGGTRVYDPDLPEFFGQYAYYPGGGGGYTGGTTFTEYTPEVSTVWSSGFGTSYAIAGSTYVGSDTNQGGASVTNGYININP
ncbi:putative Fibronectin binding protein [Yellowstone lake phycodnavirus 1]|uniref:putative Fibronectin binding protein n=1 Tax=Yellowstone lake phycodnavirus 1 TaxID=1586713 RepID=UPI0006EB2CDF|nr:putative Fibronectin binding protein [Yellowstone lake phycodnavirus 1]BAT22173.1 putative Fibronectin binding protein [Yellowstone lake phycodnavirus 1]